VRAPGSGAERLLGGALGTGASAELRQGDVKSAATDKESAKDQGLSAAINTNELRRMSLARVSVSNVRNLDLLPFRFPSAYSASSALLENY
jgi:hypothetical protein